LQSEAAQLLAVKANLPCEAILITHPLYLETIAQEQYTQCLF